MNARDWLENARKRFDFNAWPHLMEMTQLNIQCSLNINDVADNWQLEKRLSYDKKGYTDYYKSLENNKHRVMACITNYNDHNEALSGLLENISFSSATTLPRLVDLGIEIGDVGFTGYNDMKTTIIFVRYNVLADVSSIGIEPVSVIDLATKLDKKIQDSALPLHKDS